MRLSHRHNEHGYHACTTGTGMTELARRAFQNRDSPHLSAEKEGQVPCHCRLTVGVDCNNMGYMFKLSEIAIFSRIFDDSSLKRV
jgi:hypothetical protein